MEDGGRMARSRDENSRLPRALPFSHYYLSTFGWVRVAPAPGIGNERSTVLVGALSDGKRDEVRDGAQLHKEKENENEKEEERERRDGIEEV